MQKEQGHDKVEGGKDVVGIDCREPEDKGGKEGAYPEHPLGEGHPGTSFVP